MCLPKQLVASPDFFNVGYYLVWSTQPVLPQGAHSCKETKWLFLCTVDLFWSNYAADRFISRSKWLGFPEGSSDNTPRYHALQQQCQQIFQTGPCINGMVINGVKKRKIQVLCTVRNQFSSQLSCHAASAIPLLLVPATSVNSLLCKSNRPSSTSLKEYINTNGYSWPEVLLSLNNYTFAKEAVAQNTLISNQFGVFWKLQPQYLLIHVDPGISLMSSGSRPCSASVCEWERWCQKKKKKAQWNV